MQLIQVNSSTINNEVKQTVNARELHSFLEVGKDFSTWIKDQISRARLVENRDFVIIPEKGEYKKPLLEYYLTLDAGKHVAMMSNTDKGFVVRDYFIECERRAQNPLAVLSDPAAMRNLLLTYSEKVLTLESKVDELAPRAAVADRLTGADGLISIRDAAKSLKKKEKAFVVWLLENKWLYRDMKGRLRGYSDKTPKYVDHKVTPIPTIDDADKVSLQAMITPAGLTRLADIFNVEAEVYQEAA